MIYSNLDNFPKDEVFGLMNQIKRSAVSVPSNIAEGWGRNSKNSYIQFLKISRGSLYELDTQILIAKELNFISEDQYKEIENLITEESKMLNAFIKSLTNN